LHGDTRPEPLFKPATFFAGRVAANKGLRVSDIGEISDSHDHLLRAPDGYCQKKGKGCKK
jgi:hypothetical protein